MKINVSPLSFSPCFSVLSSAEYEQQAYFDRVKDLLSNVGTKSNNCWENTFSSKRQLPEKSSWLNYLKCFVIHLFVISFIRPNSKVENQTADRRGFPCCPFDIHFHKSIKSNHHCHKGNAVSFHKEKHEPGEAFNEACLVCSARARWRLLTLRIKMLLTDRWSPDTQSSCVTAADQLIKNPSYHRRTTRNVDARSEYCYYAQICRKQWRSKTEERVPK